MDRSTGETTIYCVFPEKSFFDFKNRQLRKFPERNDVFRGEIRPLQESGYADVPFFRVFGFSAWLPVTVFLKKSGYADHF
jgi:hypothetical protein